MKYIDLFAGCGGLSLGLEKAGFELVLAVEKSPMAAETFYHNFIKRLQSRDEWEAYNALTIEEQCDRKLIVNEVGMVLKHVPIMEKLEGMGIDLIAGGPPCQGFSMAGRRNPQDLRNQLPWQFLKMVESVHPKAVLIENVLGIKQNFHKHGEKAPIEEINAELRDLWPGYVTQLMEVNAMHFGVPQQRTRVMILGLRSDLADQLHLETWDGFWKSAFDIEPPTINYKRPTLAPVTTSPRSLTVGEALWDLQGSKYAISGQDHRYNAPDAAYAKLMRQDSSWPLHSRKQVDTPENQILRQHSDQIADRFRLYQLFQKHGVPVKIFNVAADKLRPVPERKQLIIEQLQKIPLPAQAPDGSILAENLEGLLAQVMRLATKKHSQRPLKWNSPAPTVLSLPDDFVHPHEARTMTVREMARLQSFPDSFIFRAKETTGSLRRQFEVPQYTQVGNAVPPLLAEAVGKRILELLNKAMAKTSYREEPIEKG